MDQELVSTQFQASQVGFFRHAREDHLVILIKLWIDMSIYLFNISPPSIYNLIKITKYIYDVYKYT